MKYVRRWAWVALAVVLVAGASYLAGRRSGALGERQKARQEFLQHNADSLRIAAAASRATHDSAVTAERTDSVARAAHAVVRQRLTIVSDSSVRVDSGPMVSVPPLVIATIRRADDALAADSTAKLAVHAELVSVMHERDLWHARADTLEREVAEMQPPHCSWKCGAIVATTVVLAVTHPAVVVNVVRWAGHLIP